MYIFPVLDAALRLQTAGCGFLLEGIHSRLFLYILLFSRLLLKRRKARLNLFEQFL